ncbi:carbohydrate-binding module family 50 protein [Bipolaris victoriae FI3]|uniref:Carbohydrate-binding module family 50 protein n=1 Tax=Bipolaris victoriae (strain FI3) TaxID=930091 RepID=W7E5H1_BIPV3|nr:carbohydrate-binding module family 50 protein [Bipolaris victoriae FI3]
MKTIRQTDADGVHAPVNGTTKPRLGNSTSGDAADLVAAALDALAVRNRLRLDNPRFNSYEVLPADIPSANKPTDDNTVPSILDFVDVASNSTLRKRALNSTGPISEEANPDGGYKYSVPAELVEAARILAESTPQHVSTGNQSDVASKIKAKYALKVNDTNAMPASFAMTEMSSILPVASNETIPLGSSGLKKRASKYWMANMQQLGSSPFAPSGYKVWRDVRAYGAKGDGVTDDTAAINRAISDGNRCGANCGSSTIHPAVVFFPAGTYLVSSSIIQYYNTQLLGDPIDVPTILAASSFVGLGVITSNQYIGPGPTDEWYVNQNNFLRSVKNFKMDITQTRWDAYVCAIHWQVAQGTSLENIEFHMSFDEKTTQQGIYMENGSGGFMSDLTFVGGNFGAYFGNQQFTTSHLVFVNCKTAVQVHWDWAWTMQDFVIESCKTGIVIVGGAGGVGSTGQGVGSLVLVDAIIANTPTGIVTTLFKENSTSLLLQNVGFFNTKTAVYEESAKKDLLAGGNEVKVESWGFGMLNTPDGSTFVNGQKIPAVKRPSMLLSPDMAYAGPNLYTRRRPKYLDLSSTQVLNVKALGAKGDGKTDDTNTLNGILDLGARTSSVVYIPFGVYIVKDTLKIPTGSRIVGQAWAQIMGTGANFEDASKPRPVVMVGYRGEVGSVEIQDMLFTVSGPTTGAVVVEWNTRESSQGSAGLWDSHIRVGGAIGSKLQKNDCPKLTGTINKKCIAASMLLHLTPQSSAYVENSWIWTADHDLDIVSQDQIDIYVARGVLVESQGPTWLYGTTSEHNVLYQYQFSNAKNVLMAMIQTESPYFQDVPKAPAPFQLGGFSNDPSFYDCSSSSSKCAVSWGVRIIDSEQIHVLGAGLYSWFSRYSQDCLKTEDCQDRVFEIDQSTNVWIYNLCTKAVREMVTPVKSKATMAKDNQNGFLSSILAWVRNGTIGERNFPGFTLYNATQDEDILDGLSEGCKTALTGIIKCDYYTTRFRELRYRGALESKNLTDSVCDQGCGRSLKAWFDTVTLACSGAKVNDAIPNRSGGIVWAGWNETCQIDSSSKQYCGDVMNNFKTVYDIKEMPRNELCSNCHVERLRMMQSNAYSTYDEDWKKDLEYVYSTCGLSGPTTVPPPLVGLEPETPGLCISDQFYTAKSGDTCDSIALANSVASAALKMANSKLYGCNDIKAGEKLCLPLTCPKLYTLQKDDSCVSIEMAQNLTLGDIRRYNPWLNLDCPNLHVATPVLGSVLCLGAQGANVTTTATLPTGPTAAPAPGDGYTDAPVDPPKGSTVAEGTTLRCGRWFVVADAAQTCTSMCVQNGITSELFLAANPSLKAADCSASLKMGKAYCVGPIWQWQSDPITSMPELTSTAAPQQTRSTSRS